MHRQINLTAGCIAVTNPEIEEIYKLVPVGTPLEIVPIRNPSSIPKPWTRRPGICI